MSFFIYNNGMYEIYTNIFLNFITKMKVHKLWNVMNYAINMVQTQFIDCMLTFIITLTIRWIRVASYRFVHALSSFLISSITLLSPLQFSTSLLSILVSWLSSLFPFSGLRLTLTDVEVLSVSFFQMGPVSKTRTECFMAGDNTGHSHVADSNSSETIWIRKFMLNRSFGLYPLFTCYKTTFQRLVLLPSSGERGQIT